MPLFTREINAFQGEAVVVGCSHSHSFCSTKHFHEGEDAFYTIDFNEKQKADFHFDITSQLPQEFERRFKLTLLECIDYDVYNKVPRRIKNGAQGFANIWNMTADDGFIVIVGCPREKEFRQQIAANNLHYIELDSNNYCILISKNQELSPQQIEERIAQLSPSLRQTIEGAKIYLGAAPKPLEFCDFPFDDMYSTYENAEREKQEKAQQKIQMLRENEEATIQKFKKIYNALYDGQSSFFKSKGTLITSSLSVERIENYCLDYPNSRSAQAWSLLTLYAEPESEELLFKGIHQYALKHSSSFFGLFKQSNNFPKNNYDDLYNKKMMADSESRTGKIRNALGK